MANILVRSTKSNRSRLVLNDIVLSPNINVVRVCQRTTGTLVYVDTDFETAVHDTYTLLYMRPIELPR